MGTELKDDEDIVLEDTPEALTKAQLAAVGQAVARAISGLDLREIIRDSVQDTLGGLKRRLRTSGDEKEKR